MYNLFYIPNILYFFHFAVISSFQQIGAQVVQ